MRFSNLFFIYLSAGLLGCVPYWCAAQRLSVDTLAELPIVVVTGQFTPTDVKATVNSVRVIPQATVQQRGVVSLQDLLITEPNMRIQVDPVLGSGIAINGLRAENVKILVDGVPVIGRLDGNIDMGQLPMQNVKRVEIIEGAQSIVYGSSASAGVINLITGGQQLHTAVGGTTALYEDNGFESLYAHAGAKVGKWNTSVQAGRLRFEPVPETDARSQVWNPKTQQQAGANLFWAARPRFTWRASGRHFDETVTNLGEIRRPTFKPYAFDDTYLTRRSDISTHGEGWVSDRHYWQHTMAYNHFHRTKNTIRYNFDEQTTELIPHEQDTSAANGWLLRSILATQLHNQKYDWLAGIELYRDEAVGARIVHPDHPDAGRAAATDLAAFAALKYRFATELTLQVGGRYTYNTQFGAAFTPALWMAWQRGKHGLLKLSYASGFRSPSMKELYFEFIDVNHYIIGNPSLQPEYTHNLNVEAQAKQLPVGKWKTTTTLTGFANRINNRIVLAEYDVLQFNYQNLESWQTAGLGLSVAADKGKAWQVRSAFVYTGFYNALSEQDMGSRMVGSAEWSNEWSWRFGQERAAWHVWHKWTGKTPFFYLDENNTLQNGLIESWHLLNSSISWMPGKGQHTFTMGVKNITGIRDVRRTDTTAGTHAGAGSQIIGWGRTLFAQAIFQFHTKSSTHGGAKPAHFPYVELQELTRF